jgi:hypothetical protein
MTMLRAGTFLAVGLVMSCLSLRDFWSRYAGMGGSHTPGELHAYLGGQQEWTAVEHDVAAHALNECCAASGLGSPVAYAREL